ncbi:MAG: response regulator, partial [Sulfuricella sp.]
MDVLLVEPEPAMSALLQAVLESRGHAVTAVTDGESGLESYQSRHFPIVILDWQLPEMNGLEVCRKIRSSPKGADSLILVITLRTNPGDLKQILAAGADDYLAKPVDKLLLNIRLAIAEQRASNLIHQRKAEEARARAQTMLQLVLNTIPSRVFWKNKESRYLGCNRLFALDAGLNDSSQIVGKTDHDLCWAEQAQLYISDDRAVMKSGLPKVNYEEHQATADGESMYLEASKIPLKDGKGNLIGVMGTYQDITKRKEAEAEILALNLSLEEQVQERTKELLAKEEQLRETLALNDSILMTSAMGIAAYRQEGQCVMANPALASIAGITQEQLLNQNFRQLSSWQASGIQEAAERVLATGARVELEIRHLTSFFGHDVWARCWLSRFTSQGEPHLLL